MALPTIIDYGSEEDYALELQDNEEIKLDFYGYEGKTDTEKRKAIFKILDGMNFVVTGEKFTQQDLEDACGDEEIPTEVIGHGQIEGVVWVNCFYDGTNKTAPIKNGKPVVWDTVTGDSVTGVSEEWDSDEYKVVGTALSDYSAVTTPEDERGKIPVRLSAPPQVETGNKFSVTTQLLEHGGSVALDRIKRKDTEDGWERSGETYTGHDLFLNTKDTVEINTVVGTVKYEGLDVIDRIYCSANDWGL